VIHALNINRRPHYSPVVARGLAKIAARLAAADTDELAAIQWVTRMNQWRVVDSDPSEPHDAAVSPTKRAGGAQRPAARQGGTR
jgi:hypothetical protein